MQRRSFSPFQHLKLSSSSKFKKQEKRLDNYGIRSNLRGLINKKIIIQKIFQVSANTWKSVFGNLARGLYLLKSKQKAGTNLKVDNDSHITYLQLTYNVLCNLLPFCISLWKNLSLRVLKKRRSSLIQRASEISNPKNVYYSLCLVNIYRFHI